MGMDACMARATLLAPAVLWALLGSHPPGHGWPRSRYEALRLEDPRRVYLQEGVFDRGDGVRQDPVVSHQLLGGGAGPLVHQRKEELLLGVVMMVQRHPERRKGAPHPSHVRGLALEGGRDAPGGRTELVVDREERRGRTRDGGHCSFVSDTRRLVYNMYKLYIWLMSKRLSASEARARFADVLDRVAHNGERVVIERRGKILGAVVGAEDLHLLERLRKLEDEEDRDAAARARKEKGSIAWALIKQDLGLG